MKCVPRVNCDFNGVMTDQTLNLTPDLEMLRVPLIVSCLTYRLVASMIPRGFTPYKSSQMLINKNKGCSLFPLNSPFRKNKSRLVFTEVVVSQRNKIEVANVLYLYQLTDPCYSYFIPM